MENVIYFKSLSELDDIVSHNTKKTFEIMTKNYSIRWGMIIDKELFNKYGEAKLEIPLFLEDLFSLFYKSSVNYRGISVDGKTIIVVYDK